MNAFITDQHYQIALDTIRNGGGTYQRDVFRSQTLPYRYVVALGEPYAAIVDAREGNAALPHLVHALRSLADTRGVWRPDRALGTWVNEGKVYVDIVESINDLDKALEIAAQRDQLAIWDAVGQVEISVPTADIARVA